MIREEIEIYMTRCEQEAGRGAWYFEENYDQEAVILWLNNNQVEDYEKYHLSHDSRLYKATCDQLLGLAELRCLKTTEELDKHLQSICCGDSEFDYSQTIN